LFALASTAADAEGMDLDIPLLKGTLKEILTIWRANGAERALKSAARHFLFDMPERGALRIAIQKAGGHFSIDPSRFIVGDASEDRTWTQLARSSYDLIVSEDVLEHVTADRLPQLLEKIAIHLRPNGIALLRPFIFTGIAGNHLPEWYPHVVEKRQKRRSAPWEHLRMDRFRANTYLNRLTRADFRSLLADHFEILEENVKFPDLGRQYLNVELRNELKHYDDDELFSNSVLFVLRRRRDLAAIE
jgi:SAM-dependent methyltransferase